MMSTVRLSALRRVRTLGRLADMYGFDAATAVGTVLRTWMDRDFPRLPNPDLPFSRRFAAEPEVSTFVMFLRGLSFLEATYWLSSAYAMWSEDRSRKKLAMFFTPASLTKGLLDDLVEQGVDFGSQSFLDPACGGAAFLAPIAMRMRASLKVKGIASRRLLRHVERHLHGTDLDKALCVLSRTFLCMALHEDIVRADYLPTFDVRQVDALTSYAHFVSSIDVVVCNPPYRKLTATELKPLRAAYANVLEGQPNLYGLFIYLCVRLLRVGGRAALVTPTSFLSGQQFSRLRTFLARNTDVEHIGMVSDRKGVFVDVEQETALTILRRRVAQERTSSQTNVSVVSASGEYKSIGKSLLPGNGAIWPIPRSIDDLKLLRIAARLRYRLADYGYKARIGAYVWNRDQRPTFECPQQVKHAKVDSAIPLLWASDISGARPVRVKDVEKVTGEPRFIDLGNRSHSSVVTAPCVVMQRVTSNDQPRRLVAAEVSTDIFETYGGFVGENHVVIVEQLNGAPLLPPGKLAKLLSAHAVDRYFRCISGATNVSAFELGQLVLPDPKLLKENLKTSDSMDEAVNRSLGLPPADQAP